VVVLSPCNDQLTFIPTQIKFLATPLADGNCIFMCGLVCSRQVADAKCIFMCGFVCSRQVADAKCIFMCGLVVGSKTDKLMGVTEMLLATSICGIVFALLSAQPLVIIGTTGPIIVFEEALYKVRHCVHDAVSL